MTVNKRIVVVRGHLGYIPGFPLVIWILSYNGCCSLLLWEYHPQHNFSFFFSKSFSEYNLHLFICVGEVGRLTRVTQR